MNRVALVTGAARGIGAATVDRLVQDGCQVVAVDSCEGGDLASRDDLARVAERHGRAVVGEVADVRDPDALAGVVHRALERWGRLDVTVAAAAVIRGGRPLWETSKEDLDLLLDVDVRGVWLTAAATVPAMLAGPDPQGCRFVAVASTAGTHGLFRLAAYNAAKHAVVGMVKGLAADLVGTGVTASVVSPGSTDTDMLRATAALYAVPQEDLIEHQLLKRVLDPVEVAAAIGFCASREGAVVNGTVLHADGGFSP